MSENQTEKQGLDDRRQRLYLLTATLHARISKYDSLATIGRVALALGLVYVAAISVFAVVSGKPGSPPLVAIGVAIAAIGFAVMWFGMIRGDDARRSLRKLNRVKRRARRKKLF